MRRRTCPAGWQRRLRDIRLQVHSPVSDVEGGLNAHQRGADGIGRAPRQTQHATGKRGIVIKLAVAAEGCTIELAGERRIDFLAFDTDLLLLREGNDTRQRRRVETIYPDVREPDFTCPCETGSKRCFALAA